MEKGIQLTEAIRGDKSGLDRQCHCLRDAVLDAAAGDDDGSVREDHGAGYGGNWLAWLDNDLKNRRDFEARVGEGSKEGVSLGASKTTLCVRLVEGMERKDDALR